MPTGFLTVDNISIINHFLYLKANDKYEEMQIKYTRFFQIAYRRFIYHIYIYLTSFDLTLITHKKTIDTITDFVMVLLVIMGLVLV